jgi:hypothetical protein
MQSVCTMGMVLFPCMCAMYGGVFLFLLAAASNRPGLETGSTRQSRIPPRRPHIDSSRRNNTCRRRVDIRRDIQFPCRQVSLLEAMSAIMLCHVQSPPSKPFKRQSRRQNTRASPTGRLLTSVSNCHSRRRRGTGRLMLARCANTGVPVALLGPSEPPVSRENDSPRTATNETNQKKC